MAGSDNTVLTWKTSVRSGNHGDCVEIARQRDAVLVRDSKDRAGPVLAFPSDAWQAFIDDVKAAGTRP